MLSSNQLNGFTEPLRLCFEVSYRINMNKSVQKVEFATIVRVGKNSAIAVTSDGEKIYLPDRACRSVARTESGPLLSICNRFLNNLPGMGTEIVFVRDRKWVQNGENEFHPAWVYGLFHFWESFKLEHDTNAVSANGKSAVNGQTMLPHKAISAPKKDSSEDFELVSRATGAVHSRENIGRKLKPGYVTCSSHRG